MGLIDKLCLWICKGKLKSVVSLDTDWFARADGIARMKGWKVKHAHPLHRITELPIMLWISCFEHPVKKFEEQDPFIRQNFLLQLIVEELLFDKSTASETIEESVESLLDGTCQNMGFCQLKSSTLSCCLLE